MFRIDGMCLNGTNYDNYMFSLWKYVQMWN